MSPASTANSAAPPRFAFAAALLKVIDRLADPAWADRARSRSQELAGQWSLESQAEAMMRIYEELSDRR
ncbi:hypothetical protein ACDL65_04795 [Corynebacterium belfantii]|uniref:hypothetical protein n=1 Tax=Corynebacterium belfantii TaxID=2014537 RepID=UPI0035308401